MAEITAVILAGGLGTRLRSVVGDRPKVLAPVHGRPFLTYLLDRLAAAGVRRVTLCTGYLGEQVAAALGTTYRTLSLTYSREPEPLGTGGALRHALSFLDSDPALVLNGDTSCETDLDAFLTWHLARGAAGSLALSRVQDASRYGGVQLATDGEITGFQEKACRSAETPPPGPLGLPGAPVSVPAAPGAAGAPGTTMKESGVWVNAGIYVLARRIIAAIPGGGAVSLERDVFPAWVGRGLYGFPIGGRFLDIGTPASYAEVERFFP